MFIKPSLALVFGVYAGGWEVSQQSEFAICSGHIGKEWKSSSKAFVLAPSVLLILSIDPEMGFWVFLDTSCWGGQCVCSLGKSHNVPLWWRRLRHLFVLVRTFQIC